MTILLRRFALCFSLIIVSALCTKAEGPKPPAPKPTPPATHHDSFDFPTVRRVLGSRCAAGTGWDNKNGPVICVKKTKAGAANPETAHAYDVQEDSYGKPTADPVWIVWLTDTGSGKLAINFKKGEPACTETPTCEDGSCAAKVVKETERKRRVCHYTLGIDSWKSDPILIVDPCCGG
jgi:hypothetical protein